ncbi:hypothetical protein [Paenibacillus thermotolerans]|uniref:hypothetical protein n=1 Tax=Paenibacillus thermotolerans TaxID=3027807 RepID=UPI002367E974|nr:MULTISPECIES: hypothetical protein [unclassified Paenibacillus]
MNEDEQIELIMGIGPKHQFGPEITKKLRVGTIREIKEVNELWRDGLLRTRSIILLDDDKRRIEQIDKWVEILNMVTIEGFTREEFEDSIPEQMELAVERFLFGEQGAGI